MDKHNAPRRQWILLGQRIDDKEACMTNDRQMNSPTGIPSLLLYAESYSSDANDHEIEMLKKHECVQLDNVRESRPAPDGGLQLFGRPKLDGVASLDLHHPFAAKSVPLAFFATIFIKGAEIVKGDLTVLLHAAHDLVVTLSSAARAALLDIHASVIIFSTSSLLVIILLLDHGSG